MESKINQKLKELYKSKIGGAVALKEKFGDKLDGPHMLYCWEQEYTAESNVKILFIGQENYGWYYNDGIYNEGICDNVEYGMCKYKDFALGAEYLKTPYWRYVHEINAHLNPGKNKNFLTTNVSKFCAGGGPLDWETHKECVKHFDCLREEIKILNPDVIIFFSGPQYDDKIREQFNKDELKFETVFEDIGVQELARIKGDYLPKHTYRIYHPNYLQRSKKRYLIDFLLPYIKNDKELPIIFRISEQIKTKFKTGVEYHSMSSDEEYAPYAIYRFAQGEYELRLVFDDGMKAIMVYVGTKGEYQRIKLAGREYELGDNWYGACHYKDKDASKSYLTTPTNDAEMKSLLDVVYPILEALSKDLVTISEK
jgi:hypothetical protein